MASPSVEMVTSGRGGSISYREGDHSVDFSWEFAMPPAMALVFGPRAAGWDAAYAWAAGRQQAIYEFVAQEVVRQQVSGGGYAIDLEGGVLEILRRADRGAGAKSPSPSAAMKQFTSSVAPVWQEWREDQRYDLVALAELSDRELTEAIALLTGRDVTWREVEALAVLDSPAAHAALRDALAHHLRIDTRLAAADILKRQDSSFDLETVLARQIRALHRPADGLTRALRLAEQYDTPVIRQALLWASCNCTECAPACAGLLLRLTGMATEPLGAELQTLLGTLGYHNSSNDRGAAFQELCRRVEMELDTSIAD